MVGQNSDRKIDLYDPSVKVSIFQFSPHLENILNFF